MNYINNRFKYRVTKTVNVCNSTKCRPIFRRLL